MKIKLYYNDYPGLRINNKKVTGNTDLLDRTWEQAPFESFHHVLNMLGIDYEWSNIKEESVILLDIGSLAVESNLQTTNRRSIRKIFNRVQKDNFIYSTRTCFIS